MSQKEIDRILNVYDEYRKKGCFTNQWHPLDPVETFYRITLEYEIVMLINRMGLKLDNMKILDIGCGNGKMLRKFVSLGADPANLCGIDLLDFQIEEARRLSPNIRFDLGNAEVLDYADKSFDFVTQFVTFSSIHDKSMQQAIATEMLRVLKDNGFIIWWDLIRNVKGGIAQDQTESMVRALFKECEFEIKTSGLLLNIASKYIQRSLLACIFLSRFKRLHNFMLAVIRKQN